MPGCFHQTKNTGEMRCFLAILLPAEVRGLIYQKAAAYRTLQLDVKWVEEENYHLTLKFFSSLPVHATEKISVIMNKIAEGTSSFELSFGSAGVFPNRKRPKVLWLGLGGQVGRLLELQSRIEQELSLAGFPGSAQSFQPHLTLGRFRSEGRLEMLFQRLESEPVSQNMGAFRVEAVHLMKSRLTPAGPVYTPLAVYPLR